MYIGGRGKYIKEYVYVFIKYFIISLAISTLVEVYVCNFRHFESYFYNEEVKLDFSTSDDIDCNDDECIIDIDLSKNNLDSEDSDIDSSEEIEDDKYYIEITDINKVADNIYLDIKSNTTLVINFDIYLSDDANELYYKAGERSYVSSIEKSKYIRINASENTKKIKLVITSINNNEFSIDDIIINKSVPLDINILRILVIFSFILLLLIINPKSIFYRIKFNDKGCKAFIIFSGVVLILVCYVLMAFNYFNQEWNKESYLAQYYNLAEALSEGHFYLNLESSEEFKEISNPYDRYLRQENFIQAEDFFWDYSYYNGKYYSYFGVLPCITIYLPYYLITGTHISVALAASIIVGMYIFGCIYFMYQLCKKYFNDISLIWYLMLTFGLLILSSGLVYLLSRPTFYYQVIIMGVALALFGLGFWIRATKESKLSKRYLLLGSLCIALTSMCRPQLLISLFFAIPLFWDYVFKDRSLLSKKSIKESLCFILPFVVIASIVMYYNHARFGSVFDFGANYNLTSNDMTKRGIHLDRTLLGIFSYLFQTTRITSNFPFIQSYDVTTNYVGTTISETMGGGYLFTNIVCILGLLFFKFKNYIKDKKLINICLCCVLFSLIIIIVDTQMAGILSRYICDFGWLLSISTIIVVLSIIKNKKNIKISKVLMTLLVITLIYNMFLYFTEPIISGSNGVIHWMIYYLFMFWL